MKLDNKKIAGYAEEKIKDNKEMLYVAGALFSKASQNQRIVEGELLKKSFDGIVFNPLTDSPANDKSKLPTAEDVFLNDIYPLLSSDFILAELDGEDAGVMVELGIACGINYMITLLCGIVGKCFDDYQNSLTTVNEEFLFNSLVSIIETIPYKHIFSHYSDLRMEASGQYDITPVGINHFLLGMLHNMDSPIINSPNQAIEALNNYHKGIFGNTLKNENADFNKATFQEILNKNAKLNGLEEQGAD